VAASIGVVVLVQDMDRSVAFYRDVLGLEVNSEEDDWAVLGGAVTLLRSPDAISPDDTRLNSVLLSLPVPDLDATFGALTGQGFAFLTAPTEVAGGRIAALRDPDGNVVQLYQPGP